MSIEIKMQSVQLHGCCRSLCIDKINGLCSAVNLEWRKLWIHWYLECHLHPLHSVTSPLSIFSREHPSRRKYCFLSWRPHLLFILDVFLRIGLAWWTPYLSSNLINGLNLMATPLVSLDAGGPGWYLMFGFMQCSSCVHIIYIMFTCDTVCIHTCS